MKLGSKRALDQVIDHETCHGAVFLSYSFDPAFFEEQVLHGLLRLTCDPVEETPRFLDEGRARLQETPVACVVDAGMRQPGRRLPYDLLEVDRTVFHPKLTLLLYAEHARLVVGSGNLTRAGYGGNSELFFQRKLDYREPEAVGLLQAVAGFLGQVGDMARTRGTQLDLVLGELERRTRGQTVSAAPAAPADIAFLTSFDGPILPRFLDLVPDDWEITRVSLLAPFHEQDDAQSGEDDEVASVLMTLSERAPRPPEVALGVAWDDAPLRGEGSAVGFGAPDERLEAHLGALWGLLAEDDEGNLAVEYFVLEELTAKQARVRDRRGTARRWPRAVLAEALDSGHAFPVRSPTAHGPAQAVRLMRERGAEIPIELHPAQRLEDGRALRQPLHGKLYLVEASRRKKTRTWVLMGSANASRAALLRGVAQHGNVEATVAFVLEGSHGLADFAPELVRVPPSLVALEARAFPAAPPNLGAWIEEAIYRARTRVLEIRWASHGPAWLGAWTLCYRDGALASGDGPPAAPTRIADFTLATDAGELVLDTGGAVYSVPILVDDLAALPVSPALANLSLRELLALLGRRIGVERMKMLRSPASRVPVGAVLEAIFGDGFGTVDVFKAWWALATDLANPDHSFASFRLRLEGPMGARAIWDELRAAAVDTARDAGEDATQDRTDNDELSPDEAWFYGAELQQTLAAVELSTLPDRADRLALLHGFLADLARELAALQPRAPEGGWLEPITRFYHAVPGTAQSGGQP